MKGRRGDTGTRGNNFELRIADFEFGPRTGHPRAFILHPSSLILS
jgi:hypothetical protein